MSQLVEKHSSSNTFLFLNKTVHEKKKTQQPLFLISTIVIIYVKANIEQF